MAGVQKRFWLMCALFAFSASSYAQTSASHTVAIRIQPITVMAVSGDPIPMSILAQEGYDGGVQTAQTFYDLTTNVDHVYIEATLDAPMPEGAELHVRATSTIGQSRGSVLLDGRSRAKRLVNNMKRGLENGQTLEYTFSADASLGPIPMQSRQVTIALVNPDTGYRQELRQTVSFGVETLGPMGQD